MRKQPHISTRELTEILGLSSSGIEWQIAKMKKEGRLNRIGGAKGGYWEVVE
jgi:ATP-dependent DNA helicase RecG